MYCKNYWFYWFYLYCFVNIYSMYSIPSHPIPSHPFPSTFVPSFPILPHLTPPYHTLFFSFLFHFIPHCPIPPYFFLLMYSSVLLLFISTFTCSLPLTFLQLLSLSPTANHLLSYLTISLPHLHSVHLTTFSFLFPFGFSLFTLTFHYFCDLHLG